MLNPTLDTRVAVIDCAATAAQTLPENAVAILAVEIQDQNAAAGAPLVDRALTIVSGAPAANQVQFAGTASAPSNQLLLNAAAVAHTVMFVRYVPAGRVPAAV